jgi:hypothetical protein
MKQLEFDEAKRTAERIKWDAHHRIKAEPSSPLMRGVGSRTKMGLGFWNWTTGGIRE